MIGVGTGKGFLVYQLHWIVGLYRERPSGVPTALNRGFGTGKGFLVYQLHWIMDLVQEKAFWCTNCLESWSLYRERPSGVPTALNRGFGTGKGRLYQRLESWVLYRKRPSVPTPWIVEFVQLRPFWSTKLSDWKIWFTTEFAVTEIVEVTGESVKFLYSGC